VECPKKGTSRPVIPLFYLHQFPGNGCAMATNASTGFAMQKAKMNGSEF